MGFELHRSLAPLGEVFAVARQGTKITLDLTNFDQIKAVIEQINPALIVNAAAYTNVNQAEIEADLAYKINAEANGIMGELAKKINATVVYYSTDYVYCGDGDTPWKETDPIAPLNVYGQTKYAGEQALIQSGAEHLILRTSWVYGARGNNFMLTMQRLFAEKDELSIVSDEFGAPTWSRMIASATCAILAQKLKQQFKLEGEGGVYNFSAAGNTSWYQFALAIRDLSHAHCDIKPILAADYQAAASRPKNSRLNHDKLTQTFHLQLPHWHDSLIQCMAEC